jgi:uncharacterized protein (TIGR02646 family)
MIRISRPNVSPKRLTAKGVVKTVADCAAYDADPAAYRSGKKPISVDRDIYGAKAVKSALMKAQHDKCCFCERKITPSDHGDVEHFRPKGSVRQDLETGILPLGYYWLAYTWTNLLVSCSKCNTTHKGTQFPLWNPNQRARTHHDPIEDERPMLVDPASEDPREHIRFRGDAPEPLTARGEATIRVLGLDREAGLSEVRLQRFNELRLICRTLKLLEAKQIEGDETFAGEVCQTIGRSITAESEFSSMAIDLVEKEIGELFRRYC